MKQSTLNRHARILFNDSEAKIPRKAKKWLLGCKISRKELRHKLKTFEIYHRPKNIYESYKTNHELFCPKCGCELVRFTGNMTEYPELYEKGYCLRCGFLVMMADNSPYYHCLDFKDNKFIIE